MQEEVTEVFCKLQHPERDKLAVRSGGVGARETGAVALPDSATALERGEGDDLARDSGAAHADSGQEESGGAGKHIGKSRYRESWWPSCRRSISTIQSGSCCRDR